MPFLINPIHIAPASARRVSVTYSASRCGDAWEVTALVTWKDHDNCWEAEFITVEPGLTEGRARALAERLTGGDLAVAA